MSTMSAENNSIKRRKIDGSASTDDCCLADLPKEALIHVATFLAAPSRALFAASLDGSSGSSDENISAIFPGNQLIGSDGSVNYLREISAQLAQKHVQKILWEIEDLNQTDILDFGKMSKEYVVQLSDDGIKTILLCVDAVNTVKRLKLANCINITGHGLEPLHGSTMIEQIDLSLVGKHQIAEIDPEPPISCEAVLPILDSIISQNGCALKHLQFPKKWQRAREVQREWDFSEYERDPQFRQFISGYDEMLTNRGDVRCLQCNENLPRQGRVWMNDRDRDERDDSNSIQNYTCYGCLKNYCHECEDEHGNSVLTSCCGLCKRMYCQQCERMNWCHGCTEFYCASCRELTECIECGENSCSKCCRGYCSGCGDVFCFDGCEPGNVRRSYDCDCDDKGCYKRFCSDCQPHFSCLCLDCGSVLCNECNKEVGANAVTFCEDCDTYCGTCRVRSCQRQEKEEEEEVCTGCFKLAHPALVEETKQLKSRVEDLEKQMKKMKEVLRVTSSHVVIARHCLGLQSTCEKQTKRVDLRRLYIDHDYDLSIDEVSKILKEKNLLLY